MSMMDLMYCAECEIMAPCTCEYTDLLFFSEDAEFPTEEEEGKMMEELDSLNLDEEDTDVR